MHTELLANLVTATITSADEQSFETLLAQARAVFPKPPVMDDAAFKSLDKMGPVKRAEYDAKLPILKKNKPPLSPPLSIEEAEKKIAVGDATRKAYTLLLDMAADMLRLTVIAHAEGFNMLKCCEEDNDILASRRNEIAIATRNEINAIDKKKLATLASDKAKIEALANKKVEEKLKNAA